MNQVVIKIRGIINNFKNNFISLVFLLFIKYIKFIIIIIKQKNIPIDFIKQIAINIHVNIIFL